MAGPGEDDGAQSFDSSAGLAAVAEADALLAGEQGRSSSPSSGRVPSLSLPRPLVAVAGALTVGLAAAVVVALVGANSDSGPRTSSLLGRPESKQEAYAGQAYEGQQGYDTSGQQQAYGGSDQPQGGSWATQGTGWPDMSTGEEEGDEYDSETDDADASGYDEYQGDSDYPAYTPWPTSQPTPLPTAAPCGWIEQSMYYPGNDLETAQGVATPEECCAKCADNSDCYAWSLKLASQECMLKGKKPLDALLKLSDPEYTSGQPTQVREAIPLTVPQPGQSTLYCWALMLPGTLEPMLLKWEWENQVSLFKCDEYAVYSNMSLTVALGVVTKTVASDLHCEKGGEFGTALNTDIFITVWRAVVADGRFKFHDWTVKVDPDSVFFPPRLRSIVEKYSSELAASPNGMYLNNCHRGMHGPIEVLSKKAVETWIVGIPSCQSHFQELCSGDCQWGEDMFMDQCLMKVLNVDRKNNSKVLVEEACDPPDNWRECHNDQVASFHPFKDVESYRSCLVNGGVQLSSA